MTFLPGSVDAVVFDMGGVFLYPDPAPARAALDAIGVSAPSDDDHDHDHDHDATFRAAHHAAVLALALAHDEAAEHDRSFWADYDRAYGAAIGVPVAVAEQFAFATTTRWDWPHAANIAAFHRLIAAGVPTAIVSNNDGTAPEQCRSHGICQVNDGPLPRVAAIIDSSLVGVAKPDPAIMAPALYALGLPPERVLYVGDTVQADVLAAGRAGMQVVQLDPFDHHAEFAHARIADVSALVAVLLD